MTSNSISSLSFFNREYREVNHGENAEEPALHNDRVSRNPINQSASRGTLPPETDDENDESLLTQTPHRTPSITSQPPDKVHKFVRRRQLWTLLFKGFLRFLFTITLTAMLLWTLFGYARKPVLVESQKRIFNTLVTALSMSLGIAIASSFKQVAVNIRWWILSRRRRPLSELDAILECDSLTSITVLAVKSTRNLKPKLAILCSLWVFINIAAQAGVAMIGLTYSLDNGVDYSKSILGDVIFTDMSKSFAYHMDDNTTAASQLAAHTYGEMALAWPMGFLTPTGGGLPEPLSAAGSNPNAYFASSDSSSYQYIFKESSVSSRPNFNPVNFISNRGIKTSGSCHTYPVHDNVNGSSDKFTVQKNGKPYSPLFESIGPKSTTYYNQVDMTCGPRCKEVCAFESNGKEAFYHECNITVSSVSNVAYPSQNISDANAMMAAGSIGLQGYQQYSQSQPMSQYQQFPAESTFGHFLGDGTQMASLMSRYAIGVFATADKIMAPIQAPVSGLQPLQGVHLTVQKPAPLWAIFICIVLSHLVLFILGAMLSNRVPVVDDSYLSIALLLRPITNKIANQGLLLGGENGFPAMEDMLVAYGKSQREMKEDSVMGLEISEEASLERNSRAWEGLYDS